VRYRAVACLNVKNLTETPVSNQDSLEYDYRILELVEQQPDISQRQLAEALGVSVGKANYVLNALLDRGLVKAQNFKKSNNKIGYVYVLTPQGLAEKASITARFLKRKLDEYDRLKAEIEEIKRKL
jgi:EPS-associated MarR family transcriptional regulator